MKIVIKEKEDGVMCLFDPRSNQFFPDGCIRNPETGNVICSIANSIIRRGFKGIVELAQVPIYNDNGYLDFKIARDYLMLNPDIRSRVVEQLAEPKVDRKSKLSAKNQRKLGIKPSAAKKEKPAMESSTGKRHRRTKAEMAAARGIVIEKPEKPEGRRHRRTKAEMEAARASTPIQTDLVKAKRHRRTKAEMEALRASQPVVQTDTVKAKRHRRTKAEIEAFRASQQ